MNRSFAIWSVVLLCWNLIFMVPQMGPVMHEADQASLLEGGFDIAKTGSWIGRKDYNFDKLYGSYWLLGAVFKSLPTWATPNQAVAIGNIFSLIALNLGFLILGSLLRSPGAILLLASLLLTPSFLTHAPFLAPNYLSAFFLCAQLAFLLRSGSLIAVGVCAFLATACRADAILAQPMLIWASCSGASLPGLLKSKATWGCLGAAGLALIVGELITAPDAYVFGAGSLFLKLPVVTAFTVFGLGSALLITLFAAAAILTGREVAPSMTFRFLGLAALFGPFAYYALAMYSTRHWTVALVTLMIFLASPRGQSLISRVLLYRLARPAIGLIMAVAVVPLFLGIQLNHLRSPRLTIFHPTLIPSADGMLPMGAYLARGWGWDRPERLLPDHSAALWQAALQADFSPVGDDGVGLLPSPLISILRLALTMRGIPYKVFESLPPVERLPVYVDFRALRKTPMDFSVGARTPSSLGSTPSYGLEIASPLVKGEGILRVIPGSNALQREISALFIAMSGDDYRLHMLKNASAGPLGLPKNLDGRKVSILSSQPFTVQEGSNVWASERKTYPDGSPYFILHSQTLTDSAFILNAQSALVAVSVLPYYMGVAKY